ncbi:MAG: HDIG domain-containing protein [Chloroflexi bacterium]|nr:HDIG domain-containing protein [Chloroflexota bacterium]
MDLEARQANLISIVRIASLSLATGVVLAMILGFQMLPTRYQFTEGSVSPQTIKSPSRAVFTSGALTAAKRQDAAARVGAVLVYRPEIDREQLRKLRQSFAKISQVRDSPELSSDEERARALKQLTEVELSPKAQDLALTFNATEWRQAGAAAARLLTDALTERPTASQLPVIKSRLPDLIEGSLSSEQTVVSIELAAAFLAANRLSDQGETERARKTAMEATEPVVVTVERGETILRDGEIVEKTHLEKLAAVGLLNRELEWQSLVGVALLAVTSSVILGLYIYFVQPRSLANVRRLILFFIIIAGTVLAAKLTVPGRPLWAHLFPLAAAPMLMATLLDAQIAIVSAAVLSILVSYVAGYSPELMSFSAFGPLSSLEPISMYFLSGVVGLLWIWRAERLNRFFIAGAGVAAATFVVTVAFWLMSPDREISQLGWYAAVSVGSGVLASSLTIGISLLLSLIFGITTNFHLLELAQPNHPLLRRLMMEAPGTYHHSIITGNLAERGAQAVGADLLFVRVGAYYHDIGKVLRPWAFSENQMPGDNIHDRLEPTTSASIVTSHVADGLKLADKYHLPSKVKDFIAEHHGTRLATYFYRRARERGAEVEESAYRYAGPRPRSKEAAIVMLADSIEATARSAQNRSPEELDQLVDRIVTERLEEGQLAESDLTLRDLNLLRAAFKVTLKGIFHPRIEYPESPHEPRAVIQAKEGKAKV